MDKNKIFASLMMTLSPISLILSLLYIRPEKVFDYFLVFSLCGLLWFTLHSVILVLMVLFYRKTTLKTDTQETSA